MLEENSKWDSYLLRLSSNFLFAMEYNPNNVVIDGEIQGQRGLEEGIRKLVWSLETTETESVGEWGWNDDPNYVNDYTIVFKDKTGVYIGPEENDMIGFAYAKPVTDKEAQNILEHNTSKSLDQLADKEKQWQYEVNTALINPRNRRFEDFQDLTDKGKTISENREVIALAKIYSDEELGF